MCVKAFKFKAWLSRKEYRGVVASTWNNNAVETVPLKIAKVAASLTQWNGTMFGDVKRQIMVTGKLIRGF